ncbi:hypothetical protein GKE73_01375 [Paludibacterium sp. dN 18-1]|uniref:Uncharacterized protein n=1 Tax=Paludibacterium denitrificans TaxID=2675226 RepID=A0A844G7W1_9NEIS|nr:hypothetical protein [Paludibacterium denitrificans]
MMVMKEIALIGPKGSGKTYLARLLIDELKKCGIVARTTELSHKFRKTERTTGPEVLIPGNGRTGFHPDTDSEPHRSSQRDS